MPTGFGFFDACDYEPKADSTAWIIQDILPKNSFGFFAGPPKGNASPHGGKSVVQRKMALSIITGQPFFGKPVLETGRVMFVNLDEDQDKQVRLYYRMTGGAKIPGYLISQAKSCRFPEQIGLLEADIKEAKPLVSLLDPLQRVVGNRDVGKQVDVGPIINELKRLTREYSVTMGVSHHSNKSSDRDKESTASWLNGSTDLDAAWDFCLCIEYVKAMECMHLRNFQKEKAKTDIFYEAEIINKDEIIDLHHILEELKGSKQARQVYNYILKHGAQSPRILAQYLGIAESSIRYQIDKCAVVKKLYCEKLQGVETPIDSVRSNDSENPSQLIVPK